MYNNADLGLVNRWLTHRKTS